MIVRTVDLRTELIGFGQIHASLQGYVPLLRGTHPSGMAEGHPLDGDIPDGMFGSADDFCQCFQNGNDSFLDGLTLSWHIVKLVFTDVVIPFARFVEQLFGIGQVEGRGMTRVGCHG